MQRLIRNRLILPCLVTLAILGALAAGCVGGSGDWYYHWNCNGDPQCLALNSACGSGPTGHCPPSGTADEGPIKANCTELQDFARHFYNEPPATDSCDQSPDGVSNPVLVSISVTPATATIARGASQTFTATGHFSDGSNQDISGQVTWSVGSAAIAHAVNNLVTGDAVGSTSVAAILGSISASAKLTVTAAALETITVAPQAASIVKNSTQQFTATGQYSDHTSRDLTGQVAWSASPSGVATFDAAGLVTGVGVGTVTVSAVLGAVTGQARLSVTAGVLQSISIVPANPQVPKGLSQQLSARGMYSDGSTQDLSAQAQWSSDTPAVATVAAGGAATANAIGTANITATVGSISGATQLTVIAASLSSLVVTPANPSLPARLTQSFTATGHYSDGSTRDLSASVTWTSGTPAVATIDASGTAATQAAGTSSIGAAYGGVSGSTLLTVTPATLVSIAVSPVNSSITTGTTEQFAAQGTYSDQSTFDITALVTWSAASSGSTTIATIDASGLCSAAAAGSATISATKDAVTGSTALTVVPPGVIWTTRYLVANAGPLRDVAASSDQAVAIGDGIILTSPDGSTWTSRSTDAAGFNDLFGVTWTGSTFAAVGFDGASSGGNEDLCQTSPDGVTWTTHRWTTAVGQYGAGVTWSGSQFVTVAFGGGIFTSPDAQTWTSQTSGTTKVLSRVAWSGAAFVAMGPGLWGSSGTDSTILSSPDGVQWTDRTPVGPGILYGVVWTGSQFIVVGEYGTYTSPDGTTWTAHASAATNGLTSIAWSGSQLVAVGGYGVIITSSDDGATWSAVNSGTTLGLTGVAWFGTRFVAVGGDYQHQVILTSP